MTFLIDKSAFARIATNPMIASVLREPFAEGLVATCGVLALEAGWSARSAADHRRLTRIIAALPSEDVLPEDWARAFAVQALLAERGQHRSAGLADLLTAACAERTGRTVLHYDADYDLVGAVTGQRTQWVVPRGTAD